MNSSVTADFLSGVRGPLRDLDDAAEDHVLADRDVLGAFRHRPGLLVGLEVPLRRRETGHRIQELLAAGGQFGDGAVALGLRQGRRE